VPLRAIVAAVLTAAVLGSGWWWFRDSSFVRVQDVFITGVSSAEEPRIRAALRAAAEDMTTLHVRYDRLRAAVAPFASVRDVRADPSFPHKLTIQVVEYGAVAALVVGERRLAVAADGQVLRGVRAERGLPSVRVRRAPNGRVTDRRALAALTVLDAAPVALRRRVTRAWYAGRGLTLDLRGGPDLVFGNAARARAKWIAAARVLADSSAAGATYLDLRVPERVAAGGLGALDEDEGEAGQPGVEQPGAAQPGAEQPGTAQPGAGEEEPGAAQPGVEQPGVGQPGAGEEEPGADQPGATQPGAAQPGADGAGEEEPGTGQPGATQPEVGQPAAE
jgi:cell division protein FtsQ